MEPTTETSTPRPAQLAHVAPPTLSSTATTSSSLHSRPSPVSPRTPPSLSGSRRPFARTPASFMVTKTASSAAPAYQPIRSTCSHKVPPPLKRPPADAKMLLISMAEVNWQTENNSILVLPYEQFYGLPSSHTAAGPEIRNFWTSCLPEQSIGLAGLTQKSPLPRAPPARRSSTPNRTPNTLRPMPATVAR